MSVNELVNIDDGETNRADISAPTRPTTTNTTVRVAPRWETSCKRCLDVLAAVVCLVLFSPLLVIIAIAIRLTSPGAVLFRQQRVGAGGELFEVKKFRTMFDGAHDRVLADDLLNARYRANDFKLPPDHPCITRVGAVLRRTSLDELPQFLNVLAGEMSLVGVRPLLAEELALATRVRPSAVRHRGARHDRALAGRRPIDRAEGRPAAVGSHVPRAAFAVVGPQDSRPNSSGPAAHLPRPLTSAFHAWLDFMKVAAPVSVVIPTIGRPGIDQTIESVANQTMAVEEIIVVADGPLPPATINDIENSLDRRPFRTATLLRAERPAGACAARNLGLAASSSKYVVFLDDDDWLLPTKVATQVDILDGASDPQLIVAGQAIYRRDGTKQSVAPAVTYDDGQGLADYLFARRKLSMSRNLIPTPTWLLSAAHAHEVRWNEALARHQDWDFLLRSEQLGGTVRQLDTPVAVVWQESVRSITSSPMARTSMDWAKQWRGQWSEQLFLEFVWGQPLRYALQARDWEMAKSILDEAGGPWPPSWSAFVMAASGTVGRHRSFKMLEVLDSLRGRRS